MCRLLLLKHEHLLLLSVLYESKLNFQLVKSPGWYFFLFFSSAISIYHKYDNDGSYFVLKVFPFFSRLSQPWCLHWTTQKYLIHQNQVFRALLIKTLILFPACFKYLFAALFLNSFQTTPFSLIQISLWLAAVMTPLYALLSVGDHKHFPVNFCRMIYVPELNSRGRVTVAKNRTEGVFSCICF